MNLLSIQLLYKDCVRWRRHLLRYTVYSILITVVVKPEHIFIPLKDGGTGEGVSSKPC